MPKRLVATVSNETDYTHDYSVPYSVLTKHPEVMGHIVEAMTEMGVKPENIAIRIETREYDPDE